MLPQRFAQRREGLTFDWYADLAKVMNDFSRVLSVSEAVYGMAFMDSAEGRLAKNGDEGDEMKSLYSYRDEPHKINIDVVVLSRF